MKALSLWQPWASLVAFGAKKYETRGWHTTHRGPLLIHASKRFARDEKDLCLEEPFESALVAGGIKALSEMPLGVLLCRVTMVDCLLIPEGTPSAEKLFGDGVMVRGVKLPPDGDERDFGNYTAGRFAWIFQDVELLPTPLPCKGMQGLFDVPSLDELARRLAEMPPPAPAAPKVAPLRLPPRRSAQRDLFDPES